MVSWIGRVSRGGWIAFGVVLGAIIGPGVALAAFSDIRIVGARGTPEAQVTGAQQLQVAAVDPVRIRTFRTLLIPGLGCRSIDVPKGSTFMVKQVVINVFGNQHGSDGDRIAVYANKTCDDQGEVASVTPVGSRQLVVLPFEPGVALRAAGGFAVNSGLKGIAGIVYVHGYIMPRDALGIRIGK